MNTYSDPWSVLDMPSGAGSLSARLVDHDHRWDFYWARNVRHPLLVLRLSGHPKSSQKLPRFKALSVSVSPAVPDADPLLVIELLDDDYRELFHRLCLDIVASTAEAPDESTAMDTAIARTWRWHYLLLGGRDSKLSTEKQRGIIGELQILDQLLLSSMSPLKAVSAWMGPLGTPKDFELGPVCIESKTRRPASRPSITITSEYQLDDDGLEAVYLAVTSIDRVTDTLTKGRTITDFATGVASRLSTDVAALELYSGRLAATGLRMEDDYSEFAWSVGDRVVYRIGSGFPRVTPSMLVAGVSNVIYSISLDACVPFEVKEDGLVEVLNGRRT